jgi:hypothetical protein
MKPHPVLALIPQKERSLVPAEIAWEEATDLIAQQAALAKLLIHTEKMRRAAVLVAFLWSGAFRGDIRAKQETPDPKSWRVL